MLEYKRYKPSDFHDDGTLKVSALLWLILLYLSRHLLILMLGGLSEFTGSRSGMDTSGLSALYSSPLFLLASAPALVVLLTRLRRVPSAGHAVRTVWRHGRKILVAGACADLTMLIAHWGMGSLEPNATQIAGAFIDVYIVAYLVRSAKMRDIFSDFPAHKV